MVIGCGGGGGGGPDGRELCSNGEDDDEDGDVDCYDADCDASLECGGVDAQTVEICDDALDNDGDGDEDCDDADCFEDPACYDVDDPVDLPGPDGDPSMDIDKCGATLENSTATLFCTTEGPFPPPDGTYSWFAELNCEGADGSQLAGVTVQHHDGVDSTIPFGIPAGNITVRQSPLGLHVVLTGVPATTSQFSTTFGIQLTSNGNRVLDLVPSTPIVSREQKTEYTAELAALGTRISPISAPATATANLADTQGAYGYRLGLPPGGTLRVCVSASMSAGVNYFPQFPPGYTFVDGAPGCTDLTNLDAANTNWVLIKVTGGGSPNNITVTTSVP